MRQSVRQKKKAETFTTYPDTLFKGAFYAGPVFKPFFCGKFQIIRTRYDQLIRLFFVGNGKFPSALRSASA